MLKISDLHKSFNHQAVLKGVSLHIERGEILVIVGPSGSGKTTLLRCINFLEKCEKGTIELDGKVICKDGLYAPKNDLKKIRQDIGLVFQNFNLFPHKTILENVIEAPVYALKQDKATVIKEAKEILGYLGLSDKENAYPFELSGGQKQRVAIGRALALHPKLMCFDEPTSALDPALTKEVAKLIRSLSEKEGMSMLIITHDMSFAEMVADRIVSMDQGIITNMHMYDTV